MHFEAPAFRRGETRRGPTLRECVLAHAAARLVLGSAGLVNVQASWVKMGPAPAGALLRAGCYDLGGTLMNHSTRAAGAAHGQEMGPEELREMATREKRVPKMRTTLYADAGTSSSSGRRRAAGGDVKHVSDKKPCNRLRELPKKKRYHVGMFRSYYMYGIEDIRRKIATKQIPTNRCSTQAEFLGGSAA